MKPHLKRYTPGRVSSRTPAGGQQKNTPVEETVFASLGREAMQRMLGNVEADLRSYIDTQKRSTQRELEALIPEFKKQFIALSKEVLLHMPKLRGEPGEPGEPGSAGYTPQPNVDYLTKTTAETMITNTLARAVEELRGSGAAIEQHLLDTIKIKEGESPSNEDVHKAFEKMMTDAMTYDFFARIARGFEQLRKSDRLDYESLKNRPGYDVSQHFGRTIHRGGGIGDPMAPTSGDVDDSNKTFIFPSKPKIVCVNGAFYRNGHGVTITGTTSVLDNPAGVGGDVYALP